MRRREKCTLSREAVAGGAVREREKEATLIPFITSLDGEPSRQRRNEANQLHRNFLSGMFAWKWHLRVLSSVARG